MPQWLEISTEILTLIVMLIGLFGLVIPIFPGGVVIWLAALGYSLCYGIILVKMMRVWYIFNHPKIQKNIVSNLPIVHLTTQVYQHSLPI